MVVLKSCEPELSYGLAELFNKCLKEYCSLDCSKVSSVVPIFKNTGEQSTAKNYCPVSLLSVVGKVFVRFSQRNLAFFLVCSMVLGLLDQLRIYWLLYLIGLLVLSIGLGLLQLLVARGISKTFGRIWHAGLVQKLTSYQIAGWSFLSNRRW